MSNSSKLLTMIPILFSLLFVGLDATVGLQVDQSHVEIIEIALGGTIVAGTANAGYKRYIQSKTNQNDNSIESILRKHLDEYLKKNPLPTPKP